MVDHLTQRFPGGPLNLRRFSGFPTGFLNSSRFPGFPEFPEVVHPVIIFFEKFKTITMATMGEK